VGVGDLSWDGDASTFALDGERLGELLGRLAREQLSA
jgi:hypothetical protein